MALATAMLWPATCSAEPSQYNSIHARATSIQFFAFGGGSHAVALKSHFSDRGAVRVGVNLSLDESTGNGPRSELPHLLNTRNYLISVSGEIQEYVDARGPVTVFVGAGPYWTRGRNSYEETRYYVAYDSTTHYTYSKSERTSWQVGGTATAGFEWFFKRKLSVIGRAGASFGFGKRHEDSIYFNDYFIPPSGAGHFDSSTASAGTSSATLGFAVYL